MADKNLNIKIRAVGAKKTKDELKGVESGLAKLGKAAAIASAAFFGAKMLLSGMQRFIELAAEQELAERQLSTALGRTSKELLDQATALQRVTTFGDEAIISQQAFLASLEFSEEQIKKIISASIDLSAATGISLESAVRNTAKTFSGLSGELGELIPQLRDLTAEEMKAGDAVKLLSDLFEGQATAQTKTLSGSIVQMKNAVGDAGEAIGALFAPVVVSVADDLKDAANFTSDFLDGLKNIQEFGVSGGIEEVKKNFDQTAESQNALGKALARYRGETIRLGMDTAKLSKESLMNDNMEVRSKREQVEFFKAAVEEEIAHRIDRETKHNEQLREMRRQTHQEQVEMLGDVALSQEETDFGKQQKELAEQAEREGKAREKSALFASQTATALLTSAVMGDNVGESLKRAVIQLGIMVAQAKIYNAIMNSAGMFTGGGIIGGITKFLFGASPTQTSPSANITINQSFSGGMIDHNFASNSLIPAINKAISTGQAKINR